jgi:hypothetical protein
VLAAKRDYETNAPGMHDSAGEQLHPEAGGGEKAVPSNVINQARQKRNDHV